MSILAAAAGTVSDSSGLSLTSGVLIGFALLACLCGAIATGLFRSRSVSGPLRLLPGPDSLWRLLFAVSAGSFIWLGTQSCYFHVLRAQGFNVTAAPDPEAALRPQDWVFIATVPPFLGFAAILAADAALLGPSGIERLGLRRRQLRGAAMGLLGIIIAFPLVFFVSEITESIYQSMHYSHPQEHELLKVMGQSGTGPARIALILGAVILAPLFEETLFRGHLQTFLRELFCRMSGVLPVIPASSPSGLLDPGLAYAQPGPDALIDPGSTSITPARPVGWQTWLAILIASAMFALVHPNWMRPMIFVLAIGLGYAYERTGNLWTNIVMHAIFNAVNTIVFLHTDH
jgi:membrane protease YdiL (CAAX protease family)